MQDKSIHNTAAAMIAVMQNMLEAAQQVLGFTAAAAMVKMLEMLKKQLPAGLVHRPAAAAA